MIFDIIYDLITHRLNPISLWEAPFFVILPSLGFLTLALMGRHLGKFGTILFSFVLWFIVDLGALFTLWNVVTRGSLYTFSLGTWMGSNMFIVDRQFTIGTITAIMLVIVITVSLLVHTYSFSYMATDPHFVRFTSYLTLFTFPMLILITGDNLLVLFLGWEGVGLCSYLLIGFWSTRMAANKAAIQAMLINRVSDLIFTMGILYTYYIFGSLAFPVIFALVPYIHQETSLIWTGELTLLSNCSPLLFLGAMGKSAQIGLHTWLPSAMEGPTPVSALIHAATMVTAGVFLVIRRAPPFEYTPSTLLFTLFIGGITAFMAASVGLVQSDIKKIIAYSTCSQLGYMFFTCGLPSYEISFFHSSNHAFFKALLFLTAGSLIHSLAGEQDTRKFGGFDKPFPLAGAVGLIGSLALMGFPSLAGYYSKEMILEFTFAKYTISAMTVYLFGLTTAIFTAFYSFRVLFAGFLATTNAGRLRTKKTIESDLEIICVLVFLGLASTSVGYITKDLFIGLGNDLWNVNLFIQPHNTTLTDSEYIDPMVKLLPLIWSVISITTSYILLYINAHFGILLNPFTGFIKTTGIYWFLGQKWCFDYVYNQLINDRVLRTGYGITFNTIDKGFLEWLGPWGLYKLTFCTHRQLNLFQSGQIYKYALLICYSIISLLFILT